MKNLNAQVTKLKQSTRSEMHFHAIHVKIKNSSLTAASVEDPDSENYNANLNISNSNPRIRMHICRTELRQNEIAFTVYERNAENNEISRNKMVWFINFGSSDHMINQKTIKNLTMLNNLTEIENQLLLKLTAKEGETTYIGGHLYR